MFSFALWDLTKKNPFSRTGSNWNQTLYYFWDGEKFLFASEKGMKLKKELGIPEGYNHMCAVALGYQDGKNPETPPRNKDVIKYIK
jgi:asparagine synthetase B (glutamine-hydrolysing)